MAARSSVHLIGLCFTEGIPDFLRYFRLKIGIFATQKNSAIAALAMVGRFLKDP
jgi:hypothetical protein